MLPLSTSKKKIILFAGIPYPLHLPRPRANGDAESTFLGLVDAADQRPFVCARGGLACNFFDEALGEYLSSRDMADLLMT